MSKKYDNYTTFSVYSNTNSGKSGPYKTYESYTDSDGSKNLNKEIPQATHVQQQEPPSLQRGNQGPIPMQPQQQPQQPQQQLRVKDIEPGKLYNILTNPAFATAKNGKPAKLVVKVHTTWCQPCKELAPKLEEMSRDPRYNEILFVAIDGDTMGPELAKILNVSNVPTIIGYVGGKKAGVVHGPNIKDIYDLCDKVVL
jgi:thiol-disulfide isomerase/thioredoxin